MENSWESILASTPFKFYIGEKKQLLTIHTSLVSYHSKPLDKMMNGHMSEALKGDVYLKETDMETFVRVAEWMYRGDYTPALPDEVELSTGAGAEELEIENGFHTEHGPEAQSEMAVTEVEAIPEPTAAQFGSPFMGNNGYSMYGQAPRKTKAAKKAIAKSKRDKLWRDFAQDWTDELPPNCNPLGDEQNSYEKYTSVFLCHAKVYVFADIYDIKSLGDLACEKLKKALIEFPLCKERIENVTTLIRYIYLNTSDRNGDNDPLRELVIKYATCIFEHLLEDQSFDSLLLQHGVISRDLLHVLLERLD